MTTDVSLVDFKAVPPGQGQCHQTGSIWFDPSKSNSSLTNLISIHYLKTM